MVPDEQSQNNPLPVLIDQNFQSGRTDDQNATDYPNRIDERSSCVGLVGYSENEAGMNVETATGLPLWELDGTLYEPGC